MSAGTFFKSLAETLFATKVANLSLPAGAATNNVPRAVDFNTIHQAMQDARARLPITPEDYGAVGDGLTNDATALGLAITACIAQKRPLQLAEKTYLVNTKLRVPDTGSGFEIIGRGHAYSGHRSTIKAGALMACVLELNAGYMRIAGVKIDANHLANFSLFLDGCSLSRFQDCYFLGANKDGVNLCEAGVNGSGINDSNSFENCWCTNNGVIYATSGVIGSYSARTSAMSGTISTTVGGQVLTGSGTSFLSCGARKGDCIAVGTGVDRRLLQIESVDSNTQITVGVRRVPTQLLSGQQFAIAVGSGYREERHNDNNFNRIIGGLWRLNACSSMSFNGLYGPHVMHPQIDTQAFYGIIIGTASQDVVYNTTVDHPYFEADGIVPFLLMGAIGVTINQPMVLGTDEPYHIGVDAQNIGYWIGSDGMSPLGGASFEVPVSFGAHAGFTLEGKFFHTASNPGGVDAAVTIVPTTDFIVIASNAGDIVMSATPHITLPSVSSGQELTVYNQGGGKITFSDEGTVANSGMQLHGVATAALNTGQSLILRSFNGKWSRIGGIHS